MKIIYILIMIVAISGCKSKKEEEVKQEPIEELYDKAYDSIKTRQFKKSAEIFTEIEQEYPYSKWANNAKLLSAYSNYQANKYKEAIIELDDFIKLYPANQYTAYAYYLKAMCYYEQMSDIKRDQKMATLAKEGMEEVIAKFPDTKYAKDSKIKLDYIMDHLAAKEMDIGRYYLSMQQYIAAIARFQTVVDDYQTTRYAPEALFRITESYYALGVKPEAEKYAAVLGYNYPKTEWYDKAYKLVKGYPLEPTQKKNKLYDLPKFPEQLRFWQQ